MGLLEKHFDTAFAAPDGVKRLRRLIWNLAVQGKLVPQDSNDSPALELLEKAREERRKLIEEKKIRKPKLSSKVSQADIPYELPHGWEWVRFGDISINRDAERIPISKEQRKETQGNYDYYGASGVIDKINDYLFEEDLLLIGEDGANLINRSTPIAFIARGKYWVNNHAHVIDAHDRDLLLYLEKYINAIDLKPYVTGTAQPKMNQVKMNSIMVALPPIPEQRRIVAKIDQLMARCDELEKLRAERDRLKIKVHMAACDRLLTAPDTATFTQSWQFITQHFSELYSVKENVAELRKAILQLAVMGKLVPQNPQDPPVDELLKTIETKKKRLMIEQKRREPKPLPKVQPEDIPYKVPNGWKWVRMDELCVGITSGSTPPKHVFSEEEGIPYLKVYNIRQQKIDFQYKPQYISKEYHTTKLKRSCLIPGDVVMNIVGPPLGKVAIIPDDFPEYNCNQAIVIFKPIEKVLNKYLYLYLLAGNFLEKIALIGTAGQDNISVTKSRLILIPLSPIPEQSRIIEKTNQLMSLCDTLEQQIDATTQKQTALLNATLANI